MTFSGRNGDVNVIDEAIVSYAGHAGSGEGSAPPYDSGSLAEIYAPRVRELLDLQAEGFTHAVWKWDDELATNRWHGVEGTR